MAIENQTAKIGILCWETGQVPMGLRQLETLVGNSTNPASYDYPVRFRPVRGANVHTILENPDRTVLRTALRALRQHPGIRAFVLECTDLPPYAAMIRRRSGLPVFDFISMINYLHSSL